MNQPKWIRLNREQAKKVLEQLAARKDAVVFSQTATDVSWQELPFYSNHRLYRLVNYATLPTFTMTYLSDGEEYIPLDGTANPIYTANEKDPIQINEENVVAYLEFFFRYVQGSEGDVFLIHDPKTMPFADTLSAQQKEGISSRFKPLKVQAANENTPCTVNGTLHYGDGVVAAEIAVAADGKITFQDQSLLLSGIHFPDSPYDARFEKRA